MSEHQPDDLIGVIRAGRLPDEALLRRYLDAGAYTDCYVTEIAAAVTHADFIAAFYTTALFRLERLILALLVARPSSDKEARELADGNLQSFAAWNVEARNTSQLLLADFRGRTRSWFMTAPAADNHGTRLYFGSAVVPIVDKDSGNASLGFGFDLLLRFHKLYSRALLRAAYSRLMRSPAGTRRFRAARREDSALVTTLYSIASSGVADYTWSRFAEPGEQLLAAGQRGYERGDADFSYKNCTVLEELGNVAGMLCAYSVRSDQRCEESDPILAPYSQLQEEGCYFIFDMAVFPQYRNRGFGKQILAMAENHARVQGLDKIGLIVFEQNEGAKRLYERIGFVERRRVTIVPHPLIQYTGDAILMVKNITKSPERE